MLTAAEVAAHCRISERTVARMVVDGCPSALLDGRRLFDLPEVLSWSRQRADEWNAERAAKKVAAAEAMRAAMWPRMVEAVGKIGAEVERVTGVE